MESAIGRVWRMSFSDDSLSACVRVGPAADDVEALLLVLDGDERQLAYRHSLLDGLTRALLSAQTVEVVHGATDAVIVEMRSSG
jgi:hypothetical protein